MIYEFSKHCSVQVRCSQNWGFRGCGHTKDDKNSHDWLIAMRVKTDKDIADVVARYMTEWRKAAL